MNPESRPTPSIPDRDNGSDCESRRMGTGATIQTLGEAVSHALLSLRTEVLSRYYRSDGFAEKYDGSIVTETDSYVENALRRSLLSLFPEAAFIGEESSNVDRDQCIDYFDKRFVWSVDPLDGTENFAHQAGPFFVSVGLLENVEGSLTPILGVVMNPVTGELFYNTERESFLRLPASAEPIVLPCASESPSLPFLRFGDLYLRRLGREIDLHKIRMRVVSCSVDDIVSVAAGRAQGAAILAHLHDFAGALPILQKAGGAMFDMVTWQPKESFGPDDFILDDPNRRWETKVPYLFAFPEQLPLLRQLLAGSRA